MINTHQYGFEFVYIFYCTCQLCPFKLCYDDSDVWWNLQNWVTVRCMYLDYKIAILLQEFSCTAMFLIAFTLVNFSTAADSQALAVRFTHFEWLHTVYVLLTLSTLLRFICDLLLQPEKKKKTAIWVDWRVLLLWSHWFPLILNCKLFKVHIQGKIHQEQQLKRFIANFGKSISKLNSIRIWKEGRGCMKSLGIHLIVSIDF